MKTILTGNNARKKLIKGANFVADIVGSTMGPKGKNVVIGAEHYLPTITNDGFLSGVQVKVEDPIEQMGIDLINVGTGRTNVSIRAGRTTTTVLSQALINQFGYSKNPMEIRKKLLEEVETVDSILDSMTGAIQDKEDIKHIATVASESEEIGGMIAELVQEIGVHGVVDVQESQGSQIVIERVKGLRVEEGYISPFMVNNDLGEAVIEDAHVVITNEKITNIKDFLPVIEKVSKIGVNKVVLVCGGVDEHILRIMLTNKVNGKFEFLVVKLPKESTDFQDIATVTGGKIVSSFFNFETDMMGRADKVVSKEKYSVFVGGKGQTSESISQLQSLEKSHKTDKRIANLMGGVAVIKVGASTDTEMRYLRMKIDDAVVETQAAIASGVVDGGGMALYYVSKQLPPNSLLKKALQSPLRRIISNSGANVWLTLKKIDVSNGLGFNASTGELVDMYSTGIIDPVKITKGVVRNAVSCASIFITTDTVITKDYDTTKK